MSIGPLVVRRCTGTHRPGGAFLVWLAVVTAAGGLAAGEGPAAAPGEEPAAGVAARVGELIQKLGDEDYEVRQRAQDELAKIGFAAYDQLMRATQHEDLEIASRAKYLVRLIRCEWTREGDPRQVKELLEDYEFLDVNQKALRIQRLALLPGGMGIGPLCRVVRFEASELLAKFAASQLMNREPAGEARRAGWAKTVRKNLDGAPNTAAQWLLTYLRLREDPQAALPEWTRLVQAEKEVVGRRSVPASPLVLSTLLYRLAAAQVAVGDEEAAERTAEEARKAYPAARESQQDAHLQTALALQRHGWFAWAAREYELVAATGWTPAAIRARSYQAEMLHDQGRDREAVEVLQKLLAPEDPRLRQIVEGAAEGLRGLKARMHYFEACRWEKEGDPEKRRQALDEALEADPAELDTLIACYHLPDTTPEYRRRIAGLIREAAAAIEENIASAQDDRERASEYNQYAWLVGNTEGEVDRALKYAHQAVERVPDSGAFLDTLAHVYYHKKDYANAVKYQTKALEVEPHSGLLQTKLAVFRKALQQQKKAEGPSEEGPDEKGDR